MLHDRIAPAIVAAVSGGLLNVVGDAADNTIIVSRRADGVVLVNGATVAFAGGALHVSQTSQIFVSGGDGNDILKVVSTNGGLPPVTLRGGNGNDTLIGGLEKDRLFGDAGNDSLQGRENNDLLRGGAGDDTLAGGRGTDQLLGDAGNDLLIWNDGEKNDTFEGGADADKVQINLSAGDDEIEVSANLSRASISRTNGTAFVLDVGTTEAVDLNLLAGVDRTILDNLAGTGVAAVNIGMGVAGAGDGAEDSVFVNCTQGDDIVQVAAVNGAVQVSGLAAQVNIAHSEAANDFVSVLGLGGADTLSGGLLAALIKLGLVGDDGNDTLSGGNGDDGLNGGNGDDTIDGNQGSDSAQMGDGNDTFVWNPGDGSDLIDGDAGLDSLQFNGSAAAETFTLSGNANGVLLERDVSNIDMDLRGMETLNLNTLGGADAITLFDVSTSTLRTVNLDLGSSGSGDGAADSVTVTGTSGLDLMSISGSGGTVALNSQVLNLSILHAEGANDTLTVNASFGDDVVSASGLAGNNIQLSLNGGGGDDTLIGSQGNDAINGDAGNDFLRGGNGNDTLNGGADTDFADGGPGTDSATNCETVVNVP